jgi:type I restriction enzyme, S subunit
MAPLKRFAAAITDGAHISPATEGGVYPFVSTKDMLNDCIDLENCFRTTPGSFEYMKKTGCCPMPGDVLFSKDGTIGKTLVVTDKREFAVASSLIIIRPREREPRSQLPQLPMPIRSNDEPG